MKRIVMLISMVVVSIASADAKIKVPPTPHTPIEQTPNQSTKSL